MRAVLVRVVCRLFVRPTLTWFPLWGPFLRLLPALDALLRLLPRLRTTEHQRIGGAGWHADLVCPRGVTDPRGAIVYFHGGAFLFGGVGSHQRIVARLAVRTGLPVLCVAYRKLPKGVLADAIDDAVSAFDWLTALGIRPGSVVLAGDSAGGHLAFATALELERRGYERPAGIVGFSPWLDFDDTEKLDHPNARTDHAIPARRLAPVARMCLDSDELDPARSPVNASLEKLPPVLLHCAADEVLRYDAELMATRLSAADVPHELHVWQGMVHAFPILGHLLPESSLVLDEVAKFVLERTLSEPVVELPPLVARLAEALPEAVPALPVTEREDPFPPLPPEPVVLPGQRRARIVA